ncbi:hmg-i/hmg-y, DNA-binding protein [Grosmannia clavigera kw1407]|uniref:Hmg-i/hmg-y, DNA-binding protein n=1 Tax=Grosmannia clavigera (strain kw1407 / UAMH 11150) TaxID=655863 RepID=F0XMH4_GROCL|nr:hmg-i/hmg-y, DNA-binding protein [Grosmannia clavigera kw1407]EFX01353.1 hmg-i/hmg-y, DNA-binding protein [Grosmannia clavigera kw1407]
MSTFTSAVGLPPLSTIAPNVAHESGASMAVGGSALSSLSAIEHRDARIKDPVPKKLKGQTGNIKGNFGVIQMDLTGHDTSVERNELAKRASESTEMAALRAYQSGHGVSSSKRFVRLPDEPPSSVWDPYYITTTATAQAMQPIQHVQPVQSGQNNHSTQNSQAVGPTSRSQSLSPGETKAEQKRLLALLRSLPSPAVVDQICKAVEYFGGSPSAAPPTDGAFPRSDLTNGLGSTFIGWIAEIFPRLPNSTTSAITAVLTSPHFATANGSTTSARLDQAAGDSHAPGDSAMAGAPAATTEKRRRGRPKGSKATKVRRDKGIKKGPMKARKAAAAAAASVANGEGRTTEEDGWVDVDDTAMDVTGGVADSMFFHPGTSISTPERQSAPALSTPSASMDVGTGAGPEVGAGTAEGKKRGRPKGSKNRPKAADVVEAPSSSKEIPPAPANVTPISPPAVPGASTPAKKAQIGRPKGFTAKPKELPTQTTSLGSGSDNDFGLSHLNQQMYAASASAAVQPADAVSMATGAKRKRAKAVKKDELSSADLAQGYPTGVQQPSGQLAEIANTSTNMNTASTNPSAAVKRQRKSADARASMRGSNASSASPATQAAAHSMAGIGSDQQQILAPLDASDAAGHQLNVAFDTLSSLGQATQQADPSQSLVSQQPRHQMQQPQYTTQKAMSATPPLPTIEQGQAQSVQSVQSMQAVQGSMTVGSPGLLTPNSSHRSPQFTTATSTAGLGTTQNTYGAGFGSSTYGQPRRTNSGPGPAGAGSPSLNGPYGTGGSAAGATSVPHSLSHHGSPSSFGATARQQPQPQPQPSPGSAGSSAAQGIQGFHNFDSQSLFDGIGLDGSTGSGGLGLGGPGTYSLGGSVPRTSANPASAYGAPPSMTSFDTNIRTASQLRDRFYNIRQ